MSSLPSQNSEEQPGLLKTLAAVFSGVLFGLFLSKLRAPIQENRKSVSPQEYTGEERSSRPFQSPIVAEIAPAPPHQSEANGRKNDTPLWKKVLEWGALGVAIGLLVVNIFQFRLTREQVHTGQRAYLVFRHPVLAELPAPEQSPEVSVELQNSGQTPATDVRITLVIFVANSPDAIQMPSETYIGYIGAGQQLKPFVGMINKLTQERYNAITSKQFSLEGNRLTIFNTQRLFFRAVVHYKDVFGVPGETTDCSFFLGKKELNGCMTGGNEMKWGR